MTPRYDQLTLKKEDRNNRFDQILSPTPDDKGVWIHQDAWFSLGEFEAGQSSSYTLHKTGNGIYLFLISGSLKINDITLGKRDGIGIWETDAISMEFITHSEILLMEVPMEN